MTTLLVILWAVVAFVLVIVLAMQPERTRHSLFELHRREDQAALRREKLFNNIVTLRMFVIGVLLIFFTIDGLAIWRTYGFIVVTVSWLIAIVLAKVEFVRKAAMRFYAQREPSLLHYVDQSWLFKADNHQRPDQKLESPEHLLHLVESAGHVLTLEQQVIIKHGLDWHKTPVSLVMTKVRNVVSIKHSELLGPLVLDDLHRSGHSRFPVIRGSIDSVVGILDISQLLDLTVGKRSETVEKTMSPQVLHIEVNESLPAALHMLQKSHQHMLIVVDDDGKTVGLVTLSDITGSLLGKTGVE